MGIHINSRPATRQGIVRRLCLSYNTYPARAYGEGAVPTMAEVETKIYALLPSGTEYIAASEVTWHRHKIYDKIITHKSRAKQTSNSNMAKAGTCQDGECGRGTGEACCKGLTAPRKRKLHTVSYYRHIRTCDVISEKMSMCTSHLTPCSLYLTDKALVCHYNSCQVANTVEHSKEQNQHATVATSVIL
ncbi:hypothetical protein CBL_08911 [Carabus blaptoides fortunei]